MSWTLTTTYENSYFRRSIYPEHLRDMLCRVASFRAALVS